MACLTAAVVASLSSSAVVLISDWARAFNKPATSSAVPGKGLCPGVAGCVTMSIEGENWLGARCATLVLLRRSAVRDGVYDDTAKLNTRGPKGSLYIPAACSGRYASNPVGHQVICCCLSERPVLI